MNWLTGSAGTLDLALILRAWRLWVLGALLGALSGAVIYWMAPLPYRARATVNVDFNLEQAWPQESDREHFYYLEREARKLVEIAWSDEVMEQVASAGGSVTVEQLRAGVLKLSQPAESGWRFYAYAADPGQASQMASTWAEAFASEARRNIEGQQGLNSAILLDVTQAANLPVERSIPLSTHLLAGVITAWFVEFFALLFISLRRLTKPGHAQEPAA